MVNYFTKVGKMKINEIKDDLDYITIMIVKDGYDFFNYLFICDNLEEFNNFEKNKAFGDFCEENDFVSEIAIQNKKQMQIFNILSNINSRKETKFIYCQNYDKIKKNINSLLLLSKKHPKKFLIVEDEDCDDFDIDNSGPLADYSKIDPTTQGEKFYNSPTYLNYHPEYQ